MYRMVFSIFEGRIVASRTYVARPRAISTGSAKIFRLRSHIAQAAMRCGITQSFV
ncbi:hypothetical protein X737_24715 [Mesorhizobium sp. L48C026A00]|nr:hypothetical protein X737_24715 [Mesorhizobium sp. L48C026A00]